MKNLTNTIIISASIIITAIILSGAWIKSHKKLDNTIYVTGLATKDFESDLIVWNCSFSRKSMSIKDAYKLLKKDSDNINDYLIKKGVNEKEFVFTFINIQRSSGLKSQTILKTRYLMVSASSKRLRLN